MRSALIAALWLMLALWIATWPVHDPLRGLVVAVAGGVPIAFGLYFVFRDPTFADPSRAAEQRFGAKLWHKLAIALLVVLVGVILVAAIATREWGVAAFLVVLTGGPWVTSRLAERR